MVKGDNPVTIHAEFTLYDLGMELGEYQLECLESEIVDHVGKIYPEFVVTDLAFHTKVKVEASICLPSRCCHAEPIHVCENVVCGECTQPFIPKDYVSECCHTTVCMGNEDGTISYTCCRCSRACNIVENAEAL